MGNKCFILFLFFSIIFFSSCNKFEWHNPYDSECPKSLFTPNSLKGEMIENTIKLTWLQDNENISGFEVFRSSVTEGVIKLAQTQKEKTEYFDISISPGKQYSYYVLAYAGTNKSDSVKINFTPFFPASVITGSVSDITTSSVTITGDVLFAGGDSVISRGVCWSTSPNATINNSRTKDGAGSGKFTSAISGLLPGFTYYAKAYAENSRGVSYGIEISFTTNGAPKVSTKVIQNITTISAFSGGKIISDGGLPIVQKGICFSNSPNPTIESSKTILSGEGSGEFTTSLTGLTPSTIYYVRAFATNSFETSYGEQYNFTTASANITLTTLPISGITANAAQGGGSITADAGIPITAKGICWSKSPNPTIQDSKTNEGVGSSSFNSQILGLDIGTTYYVRAYAQNQYVTSYGNQVTFASTLFLNGNGVTDIEGTKYKTIIIGNQEWMAENLKTIRLNNGDILPNGGIVTNWQNYSRSDISAYADPATSSILGEKYGRLYNFHAVNNTRKLCPTGWHIPSLDEWNTLESFLGVSDAAYKIKSIDGWIPASYNGNNLSGMNALPAGGISFQGTGGENFSTVFWTSTKSIPSTSIFPESYYIRIIYNEVQLGRFIYDTFTGASVRCVKD